MSAGQNSFQTGNTLDAFKYLTIAENQVGEILQKLGQKLVKVSSVLSYLDISPIASQIQQRESIYSVDSLLKLYLYKRVKGFTTYPILTKNLEESKDCLLKLGLQSIPTKQNFNHFFKSKVNSQMLDILDRTAEKVLAVATQKKCILDLEIVKKNISDYKNKAREETKVLKQSTKLLKRLIYPQIKIKMGKNSRFTTKDLLDILVHIAQTHDFANNGCKSFNDLYEDKDVPDSDTLLYHLKKIGSIEDIRNVFAGVTEVMLNFAKQNYNLFNRRKLDIAYDIHKIPYYCNINDDYVKGSKNERGTSYFYHFLTCDIVVAGKKFTIDVLPVHPLDAVEDLLDESLKKIKRNIHIDRVFLDRGFANSKCVISLKKHNLNFVMPIARNDRIKQWMDKSEACQARLIENYEVTLQSNVFVNLYFLVGVKLYGKVPEKPLITAKRFSIMLYKIQEDYPDPGD